jgi:hypothetical protein
MDLRDEWSQIPTPERPAQDFWTAEKPAQGVTQAVGELSTWATGTPIGNSPKCDPPRRIKSPLGLP